jgi:hypothetical protein
VARFAAAVLALTLIVFAVPARAELQTDPLALARAMNAAYAHGSADGWPYADELDYFSTVLDAGRAYELRRRDDPANLTLKGVALDLAVRLNYDPLTNRDAAEWYVRLAARAYADDPVRGAAAKALLAKLDAEDGDTARLAHDADADATANLAAYPNDRDALVGQVDADLRAYGLTKDTSYRALAIARAAQPTFPIGTIGGDTATQLLSMATAAGRGDPSYSEAERYAAKVMNSHYQQTPHLAVIGAVRSHQSYLVITAPADEYFGHTKLSPIGVRNEIVRIGKYLDKGWGSRMTQDMLYVVDALDDWRQQYPRDYELPRLLLATYKTLERIDSPAARKAEADVRSVLTVQYNRSREAQELLLS